MQQKQQCPVIDARQAWAKTTAETKVVVLFGDVVFFRLPFHAKGWVGQHVVKVFVGVAVAINEPVLGFARTQRVPKGDVGDVFALDHQIRAANGIRLRVVLLPKQVNAGTGVQAAVWVFDDFFRFRQHPACAAGRVVNTYDFAFFINQVVMRQQQIDHQLDDFARREMIARFFIGLFVETPHEIFKQIAHGDVGDGVRMQVYICHLLNNFKQAVCIFELLNLLFELELFNDLARTARKPGDKVHKVCGQLFRVTQQIAEGKFAGVVKVQLELVVHHGLDGVYAVFAFRL